jgi:hypothetical protein
MNLIRFATIGAVVALAGAGTALAYPGPGRPLYAALRANAEVPGPGNTDARGNATVRITPGRNRVCYSVTYRNIPQATMAHIHSGRAGVAGPPVVTLRMPRGGMSDGCANVSRALARDLINRPDRFYVNIHSVAFPDGAIRGQFHR